MPTKGSNHFQGFATYFICVQEFVKLHPFVYVDKGLALRTAMLYVLAGVHAQRNQTTWPNPERHNRVRTAKQTLMFSHHVTLTSSVFTSYQVTTTNGSQEKLVIGVLWHDNKH